MSQPLAERTDNGLPLGTLAPPAKDGARLDVCLATQEVTGPFRNGGIGGENRTMTFETPEAMSAELRWMIGRSLGVARELLAGVEERLERMPSGEGWETCAEALSRMLSSDELRT